MGGSSHGERCRVESLVSTLTSEMLYAGHTRFMQIVVVGMGEVGTHVVRVLQENHDHDVVALDNNQAQLARVEEEMDVATAVGFGANPNTLRSAGAHEADLVVAVTNNDAVNLVASLMAKRMGALRAVARIQGKDYDDGILGV